MDALIQIIGVADKGSLVPVHCGSGAVTMTPRGTADLREDLQ